MLVKECYNVIEPYAQNTDIGLLCKQTQIAKFLASILSKTELVASTENFGHLADTEWYNFGSMYFLQEFILSHEISSNLKCLLKGWYSGKKKTKEEEQRT